MNYFERLKNRAQTSVLQIYDLETGRIEEVARFSHVIEAPNWTKDGAALVYNAEGKIFRFDFKTKIKTQLPTGEADTCNNDHVLSPLDGRIAVSSGQKGDFNSRIYIVDPQSGASRLITPTPHSYLHGWSPDGKTLAFCGAREYDGELQWDVYTIGADGKNETRLTEAPGLNDGPEYSPDGKHIWFNSVRTGLMQIWRMNADGTEQTQMSFSEDRNSWFPHISPDGTKVVYLAYRKGDSEPGEHLPDKEVELRMIASSGGAPQTLCSFFGGQGSINVNSWSPDSRKFAFVRYERP